MLKHLLIILSGLFMLAIPTLGQSQQPIIESITVRQENGQIVAQIFGNLPPPNCNTTLVTTERQGNIVRVGIGESFAGLEQACTGAVLPDDAPITVRLPEDYEVGTLYTLMVNDVAVQFDPANLANGTVLELEPLQLFEGFVTEVGFLVSDENTLMLDFTLEFTNGCDVEPQGVIGFEETGMIAIDWFVVQPSDSECTEALRILIQSIDTGLLATESYWFELGNRHRYLYSPDMEPLLQGFQPEFVHIDEVIIEQTADDTLEYTATMSGSFTGCAATTAILQSQQADLLIFDVVHYAPLDIDCEGETFAVEEAITFQPMGASAITVNGMTYALGDISSPLTGSNSPLDRSGGGNIEDRMQGANQGFFEMNLVIEDIQVEILESFPMQLNVRVTGYAQDGCEVSILVEQSVTDNRVNIRIFREMDPAMTCMSVIVPYEEAILVDGGFTGGTVTITVNDQTIEVDL